MPRRVKNPNASPFMVSAKVNDVTIRAIIKEFICYKTMADTVRKLGVSQECVATYYKAISKRLRQIVEAEDCHETESSRSQWDDALHEALADLEEKKSIKPIVGNAEQESFRLWHIGNCERHIQWVTRLRRGAYNPANDKRDRWKSLHEYSMIKNAPAITRSRDESFKRDLGAAYYLIWDLSGDCSQPFREQSMEVDWSYVANTTLKKLHKDICKLIINTGPLNREPVTEYIIHEISALRKKYRKPSEDRRSRIQIRDAKHGAYL